MSEQQPERSGQSEQPSEQDEQAIRELAGRVFEAARTGDAETLGGYVDAGLSANLANDRGDTLLMLAAYHGHADAVRALLARGADPDRANDRGQTPLAGAIFKNERDVVAALVAAGADADAGTPSARETAAMFGKADMLS
ncbi:ankyrin repeat domain-containing protein [Embleya sp. NBC_00896]|uniref:ankyrin repeat domain-containing protein n=1 Tax=Embleya sp. NBC_00896 TaxID=2975961 RepID=UPI00386EDE3F|nr:ankyrin repeat domain-containing protein [Embleya sp. NBC_00896]